MAERNESASKIHHPLDVTRTELDLDTRHTYDAPGEYAVVVKVIDILGNDTTKTVKVKVK